MKQELNITQEIDREKLIKDIAKKLEDMLLAIGNQYQGNPVANALDLISKLIYELYVFQEAVLNTPPVPPNYKFCPHCKHLKNERNFPVKEIKYVGNNLPSEATLCQQCLEDKLEDIEEDQEAKDRCLGCHCLIDQEGNRIENSESTLTYEESMALGDHMCMQCTYDCIYGDENNPISLEEFKKKVINNDQ